METRRPNEVILHDTHAELILQNNKGEEVGRTKIDLEDLPEVRKYRWHLSNGYARCNALQKTNRCQLHRLVLNPPRHLYTDHINRDKLDNRRGNLRVVTCAGNSQNRPVQGNNVSGHAGVHYETERGKWRARIKKDGRKYHIGWYNTREEAIAARKVAEKCFFGEFPEF